MGSPEDVPEADRLEQETPSSNDSREFHRIPPEAPVADVLEQEHPIVEEGGAAGIDADRTEPVSDDDWASTSSG